MYKITLADGTVLNDIDVNGTTLVSKAPISESIFQNNLSPVDIERIGEISPLDMSYLEGHHENMKYIPIQGAPEGQWYFALVDIPQSELQYAKIRSDIEYIAMMTDVEL